MYISPVSVAMGSSVAVLLRSFRSTLRWRQWSALESGVGGQTPIDAVVSFTFCTTDVEISVDYFVLRIPSMDCLYHLFAPTRWANINKVAANWKWCCLNSARRGSQGSINGQDVRSQHSISLKAHGANATGRYSFVWKKAETGSERDDESELAQAFQRMLLLSAGNGTDPFEAVLGIN